MIKKFMLALSVLAIAVSGVTSPLQAKRLSCASVYKKHYLPGRLHRALATSNARSPFSTGSISCGWGEGYPSKKQAISAAIRGCNGDRQSYHTPGTCKILKAQ